MRQSRHMQWNSKVPHPSFGCLWTELHSKLPEFHTVSLLCLACSAGSRRSASNKTAIQPQDNAILQSISPVKSALLMLSGAVATCLSKLQCAPIQVEREKESGYWRCLRLQFAWRRLYRRNASYSPIRFAPFRGLQETKSMVDRRGQSQGNGSQQFVPVAGEYGSWMMPQRDKRNADVRLHQGVYRRHSSLIHSHCMGSFRE